MPEPPSVSAWRAIYPNFKVFDDDAVMDLIPSGFTRRLYQQIVLPAAKSDLARLLLLNQFGGLYVDAHTGPSDPGRLVETFDHLSAYELVIYGKQWEIKQAHDFNLMNTVILARAKSSLIQMLIDRVSGNLAQQYDKEQSIGGYSPYSLHDLTGTQVIIKSFFENGVWPPPLAKIFDSKIKIVSMPSAESEGFHIYQFYDYRTPGSHWSEREKVEPLFRAHADIVVQEHPRGFMQS